MLVKVLLLFLLHMKLGKSKFPSYILPNFIPNELLDSCELIFASNYKKVSDGAHEKVQDLTRIAYDYNYRRIESSSSGTFVVQRLDKGKHEKILFKRLQDIHKYNHRQCAVAFIYVSQLTSDLPKWLFETLTPRYVPIIRKDEDIFVLVTERESDADRLLLSPEFGNKVKFKIGLVLTEANKPVTLKRVELYSEHGGLPKIHTNKINESDKVKALQLFPGAANNFHQKLFRVANPKAPFYFEMKPDPTGNGNIPVRGLYKVWLDVMIERFNFTIDLFQSSLSGGTGKQLKNGTWLGAVADVLNEKCDMAIYIGHIYNRHEFVEWSTPLTYEWLVFITHKPTSFYSASSIFKPFPVTLWIGFIASLVLICITLKAAAKCIYGSTLFVPSGKMLLYLLTSFLEQDAQYYLFIIHLNTVRVISSFWLLVALILSTVYRGKLVALLGFPALTWVPSTFDDLAYSGYRVGVNVLGKGGAAYSVLSTSKSPVYQNLFNRMEIYPDPAVCMREGLLNNIGCIMWKSVADSTEAKNFTDKFGRKPFRASEQTTSFIADGYIWEKRAIFRQNFDRLTWSMVETGLSSFWFQSDLHFLKSARLEWERQIKISSSNITNSTDGSMQNLVSFDNDGPSTLKIVHLMGLGYIFLCGNICGLVGFLVEWFTINYSLKLKQNLTD